MTIETINTIDLVRHKELLEFLNRTIPRPLLRPQRGHESTESIWFESGRRALIEDLLTSLRMQEERSINRDVLKDG